ncbi:binding-protein-dependent transport systems inner membrane component [Streptomyces davaonensis JCM 4913]|uniref:Binding-protein-dependent transport systems inner membrane component n=1 Tax=Streptomyces davaonensis (strain DSM 101723 / JCM 4913 / KCC S-0913 / 768) TaxID=1214101 RepID=K4QUD4_STRDJ|nr:carbohydrate ABC transporter permease [Streptomyces davaonensis]CCK24568.1 binding-protein-dependent transport systems inner membrane component [Streptomyces davaonensis JCM 4913]
MSTDTELKKPLAPPTALGAPPHGPRHRGRGRIVVAAVAYLITFVILFPLLWIVLLSFQTNDNILNHPFSLSDLTLANYQQALETLNLLVMYKNTLILAVVSVTIGLIISYMAAFALTRMVFRGGGRRTQNTLRYYFLAGLAIPVYILLFPVYRLDIAFGLFGTYFALILPYVAVTVPFNILLLTGFLRDFPEEIEQAAVVDGAGTWRMAWKVAFPLMRPVVATLAILNVIYVWNEFPFAVTLINDPNLTTVSLGVSQFQGVYSVDYGAMMASATLVLLPQLAIYAAFQKQVIAGMTAGAVR